MYAIVLIVAILACIMFYQIGKFNKMCKLRPAASSSSSSSPSTLLRSGLEYGKDKHKCSVKHTYCFDTRQCNNMCIERNSHLYECNRGVCELSLGGLREHDLLKGEDCDSSKGMITFLVGDTAFGSYTRLCKSVDPGIAVSNKINLMCKNDPHISIDYHNAYPKMSDCSESCTQSIIVPATRNKRRHKECGNPLWRMVEVEYPLLTHN